MDEKLELVREVKFGVSDTHRYQILKDESVYYCRRDQYPAHAAGSFADAAWCVIDMMRSDAISALQEADREMIVRDYPTELTLQEMRNLNFTKINKEFYGETFELIQTGMPEANLFFHIDYQFPLSQELVYVIRHLNPN